MAKSVLAGFLLFAAAVSAVPLPERTSTACQASTTAVQMTSVPKTTQCIIAYDANWRVLQTINVNGASGAISLAQAFQSVPSHVEMYSVANCNSGYMTSTTCKALSSSSGATQAPTTAATNAPTTAATHAPTTAATHAPTAAATHAPTTAATNAPTTAPTTSHATAPPTSAPVSGSRAPRGVRSMFVWEYSACLFNAVTSGSYSSSCQGAANYLDFQNMIFDNVLNPYGQFPAYNRLYVEIDINTVNTSPDVVRAFLKLAHSKGIAIEFLGGQATWVTTAALAATPMGICDNLVTFNQGSSDPTEWFDGVNFDIEPHTLGAAWHTNTAGGTDHYNQAYQATFLTIFNHCMAVTRPTTMTVTWCAGNDYYYFVNELWNPLKTSSPFVDYVTVMNYFSSTSAFNNGGAEDGLSDIGGVTNILASLQGGNVPAVFAAESMPPAYAPASASFWAQGAIAMEATEAQAVQLFSSNPLFAGTSTHWYSSYLSMGLHGNGN